MSKRVEMVNSLLQREVGKIIQRQMIFSGSPLVTLTRVDTSANLMEAKVYISTFPEEKTETVLKTLNDSVFDIQQQINKRLKMRPVPKIKFIKDAAISGAARIEEILRKTKNEK